jgi:hypothetical protein
MSGQITKTLTATLLALTFLAALIYPYAIVRSQSNEYYSEDFAWTYKGQDWTWSLDIPKTLYDAYKAVPVYQRVRNGVGGYGLLTTTEDSYMQSLADELTKVSDENNFDSYEQVSFALAFVQSLPYTSDAVTSGYDEYPRFPIETLVDDGGDCEDTSILFATLTLQMGYGVVYINPPSHCAVGVKGDDIPGGYYWNYPVASSTRYYYCETTGDGWEIGELPDEYIGGTAPLFTL